MFGSAAVDLAWVADGTTDLAVVIDGKVGDISAGIKIARGAGAMVRVTEVDGQSMTTKMLPGFVHVAVVAVVVDDSLKRRDGAVLCCVDVGHPTKKTETVLPSF